MLKCRAPAKPRFSPTPTRAYPLELLKRQASTRVAELVPIRYGRMLVSPFTFYRGAAMIMAHDLAATPRSGLNVQMLRRCLPVELRVFDSAGAVARIRPHRFRRDASRSVEWDVKRCPISGGRPACLVQLTPSVEPSLMVGGSGEPELLQDTELVGRAPTLDHPTVRKACNLHIADGERPVGRLVAHEPAGVAA